MSYLNLHEPCGYTCGSIDGIISRADAAINILNSLTDCEEAGVSDAAIDVIDCLNDIKSDLEDVRANNSALRSWGHDLADAIKAVQEMLQ